MSTEELSLSDWAVDKSVGAFLLLMIDTGGPLHRFWYNPWAEQVTGHHFSMASASVPALDWLSVSYMTNKPFLPTSLLVSSFFTVLGI